MEDFITGIIRRSLSTLLDSFSRILISFVTGGRRSRRYHRCRPLSAGRSAKLRKFKGYTGSLALLITLRCAFLRLPRTPWQRRFHQRMNRRNPRSCLHARLQSGHDWRQTLYVIASFALRAILGSFCRKKKRRKKKLEKNRNARYIGGTWKSRWRKERRL